jgi:hypothetical protein
VGEKLTSFRLIIHRIAQETPKPEKSPSSFSCFEISNLEDPRGKGASLARGMQ